MEIREINIPNIAKHCIEEVFRKTTDKPGFVHLDFGNNIGSHQFRSIMVELKKELSNLTQQRFNKKLSYHWLVRFDQQVNTPYHLDNAGDQSFLMLGYEPSEIESELYLADYFKYANESEAASKDYLENFNPVFINNDTSLEPYTTKVKQLKKAAYKIVLINNSKPKVDRETLGVFHKASIINPDKNKSRIVNSMIVNMIPEDDIDKNQIDEMEFISTDTVSK